MRLNPLTERPNLSSDPKLNGLYLQFGLLLNELNQKELSQNLITSINADVEQMNQSNSTGNEFKKLIKQKQTTILKQVEKEHKFVPKNYYRNLWMLLGFTAFGLPIGVAFGLSMGNIGLMAIGLPIGMGIGSLVGTQMDKKALKEGRQMDLEIKF